MELALFIYLAGVAGNLGLLMVLVNALLISLSATYAFTWIVTCEDERFKFNKFTVIVPVLVLMLTVVIPSEKTMYMMLAGYTGQQVIQSETASKLHKVIDSKLDEYILEMNTKRSSSGVITEKK